MRRVFSSRKLLSSKLEPKPESEQEIQRDLLLQLTRVITLSDVQQEGLINGNNFVFLLCWEEVVDTVLIGVGTQWGFWYEHWRWRLEVGCCSHCVSVSMLLQ